MSQFYDNETPSGTINGVNTVFTLTATPNPAESLQVYNNGVLQMASLDYILSTATLTFQSGSIPFTGDLLRVFYRGTSTIAPGSIGILRDAAVTLIMNRLGNRTGLEASIITELQMAQLELETEVATLPWFLIASSDDAASASPLALPTAFLRELDDEDSLWIVDADDGSLTPVVKDDYGFLARQSDLEGTGQPQFYAAVGGLRHLFPAPDVSYTFRSLFYQADTTLDSNVTNNWLTYAARLLISQAGIQKARFLRDTEAKKDFGLDLVQARRQLIVADTAHRNAAMQQFKGGG